MCCMSRSGFGFFSRFGSRATSTGVMIAVLLGSAIGLPGVASAVEISCVPSSGLDVTVQEIRRSATGEALLSLEAFADEFTSEVTYRVDLQDGLLEDQLAVQQKTVPGGLVLHDLLSIPLRPDVAPGIYFGSLEATADHVGDSHAFAIRVTESGGLELMSAKDAVNELHALDPVPVVQLVPHGAPMVAGGAAGAIAEPAERPIAPVEAPEEDRGAADGDYTFEVSGKFSFWGWDSVYHPMINCTVRIYDEDTGSDDLLATTITSWDGEFSTIITSGDSDGPDIYVEVSTENASWITTDDDDEYVWTTWIVEDQRSNLDFGHMEILGSRPAAWVFDAMNSAWNTSMINDQNPGFMEGIWPGDGTFYSTGSDEFEISVEYAAEPSTYGPDVIIHEWAHQFMDNAFDGDWPPNTGGEHWIHRNSNLNMAWTEGFADFYPLTVDPDGWFDWRWTGGGKNLESSMYSFDVGEACEGRIAASLLDLWDLNQDELDQNSSNSVPLATLLNAIWDCPSDTWDDYWSVLHNWTDQGQEASGYWSVVQNTLSVPPESTVDWAEPNNKGRQATDLSAGAYYTNFTLDTAKDKDIFRFWATAGTSYAIETYSDRYDTNVDTRLRVFSSKREKLADDDDGGEAWDSWVLFTPDTSGYYYILVTGVQHIGSDAPYALSILTTY